MISEYRKAGNQSDTCPALANWINDYVNEFFGQTSCSFDEILENVKQKNDCQARVQTNKEFRKQC